MHVTAEGRGRRTHLPHALLEHVEVEVELARDDDRVGLTSDAVDLCRSRGHNEEEEGGEEGGKIVSKRAERARLAGRGPSAGEGTGSAPSSEIESILL